MGCRVGFSVQLYLTGLLRLVYTCHYSVFMSYFVLSLHRTSFLLLQQGSLKRKHRLARLIGFLFFVPVTDIVHSFINVKI